MATEELKRSFEELDEERCDGRCLLAGRDASG